MTDEIFKEVSESNKPKVLEALREDWPKHFVLHQLITILDVYKKSGTKWKHDLYLHGDYKNGVYLSILTIENPSGINKVCLYTYTTSADLTEMKKALKETHLIKWQHENLTFTFINSRFSTAIQNAFAAHEVPCEVSPNTMFWFPPNKDYKIQPLPEDVYVKYLDATFADQMNENWAHKFPGSNLIMKENLEKNFGLGLFKKGGGKLVSSALSNYAGGIFVLFCDPDMRGRGYATILVQHMIKEIRRQGRIPFATVILGNKPSESVFRKAGFEIFCNADYLFPKY